MTVGATVHSAVGETRLRPESSEQEGRECATQPVGSPRRPASLLPARSVQRGASVPAHSAGEHAAADADTARVRRQRQPDGAAQRGLSALLSHEGRLLNVAFTARCHRRAGPTYRRPVLLLLCGPPP